MSGGVASPDAPTSPGASTSTRTVGLGLAVTVAAVLPVFMLGALAIQMGRDLGFAAAGLGAVTATFFLAAAVGSIPLGRLAERLGGARSLGVAALGSAACCAAVAVAARSFWSLLVLLGAAGAVNGMAQPAVNAFLAGRTPADRQAFLFGVKQSAIPVAVLLSGAALPLLALTVGWRWAYAGGALVAAVVALTLRGERDPAGGTEPAIAGDRAPTRSPNARVLGPLAVAAGLGAFAGTALGAFLVTSAVAAGIGEGSAGVLLAVGSAVCIVVRVSVGLIADRRASEGLVPAAVLLAVGAFGFALVAEGSAWAILVGSLVAFGAGWGFPGLINFAVVARTPGAAARATGVTQTGVYLGAGVGPLVFGQIAERASLATAWTATAVSAALAAGIIVWWRRAEVRGQAAASGSTPFHVPSDP